MPLKTFFDSSKLFFPKIPLRTKFICIAIVIIATVVATVLTVTSELFIIMRGYHVALDEQTILETVLNIVGKSLVVILACLFYLYIDNRWIFGRLNTAIKDALAERRLDEHFDYLYQSKQANKIIGNVSTLFTLFKSFDNMKSSRVATEASTINTIFDHLPEGLMIINAEKIVTQANHPAEQMLSLISGEIIGQTISRKITEKNILSKVDLALEQDQKTKDKKIKWKDKDDLVFSVYPIKNRQGEVIRALVIFTEAPKKEKK